MNTILVIIILIAVVFILSGDKRLNEVIKNQSIPVLILLLVFYFFFNKIDFRILCVIFIIVLLYFSKFGSKIRDKIDYFIFNNIKYLISKSGFSKQGGYEIHLENIDSGLKLYDYFFEIGDDFNLKPGCPNAIERIEGALLSYGNDMDNRDNPFECGFDKYVDLDKDINFLGKDSLKKIKKEGIKKKLMGVKIDLNHINLTQEEKLLDVNDNLVGFLRSAAFSPKFNKVVGIAMINKQYCNESEDFRINIEKKISKGKICSLPII